MNNNAFENTILAYLEGLLDPREEAEFLRTIARDPEKQRLLDQHRILNAALDRQRKSLPPLHTEQALAERVPVLRSAPPAKEEFVDSRFARTSTKNAHRNRTLLLIVGTLIVAVLTGLQLSGSIFPALMDFLPQVTKSDSPASSGRSTSPYGKNNTIPEQHGIETEATDTRDAVARSFARAEHGIPSTAGDERNRNAPDYGIPGSERTANREIVPTNTSPVPLDEADITPSPRDIPQRGGAEIEGNILTPRPMASLLQLLGSSVHAYLESGTGKYELLSGSDHADGAFSVVYLAGIRWDVSARFTAGLEIGSSSFGRQVQYTRESIVEGSPGVSVLATENGYEHTPRTWVRFLLLYTLNPQDFIRIQAGAGSGVTLGSDRNLVLTTGVSALYPLGSLLILRSGVHYSGGWLAPGTPRQVETAAAPGNPVGRIFAGDPGTVYTSSLEFRIGIGVLLW